MYILKSIPHKIYSYQHHIISLLLLIFLIFAILIDLKKNATSEFNFLVIILYSFPVDSTMIRHLHHLGSDLPPITPHPSGTTHSHHDTIDCSPCCTLPPRFCNSWFVLSIWRPHPPTTHSPWAGRTWVPAPSTLFSLSPSALLLLFCCWAGREGGEEVCPPPESGPEVVSICGFSRAATMATPKYAYFESFWI